MQHTLDWCRIPWLISLVTPVVLGLLEVHGEMFKSKYRHVPDSTAYRDLLLSHYLIRRKLGSLKVTVFILIKY